MITIKRERIIIETDKFHQTKKMFLNAVKIRLKISFNWTLCLIVVSFSVFSIALLKFSKHFHGTDESNRHFENKRTGQSKFNAIRGNGMFIIIRNSKNKQTPEVCVIKFSVRSWVAYVYVVSRTHRQSFENHANCFVSVSFSMVFRS